jgi:CHAT domain-containing protein
LAKREAEVQELEASASVMSRSVLDLRAPDLATIQRTIPADAVVIEFVRYLPFDKAAIERHSRFGPGNYAALVMGRDHEPRWLDIGSAADIDARINRWRAALAGRDQKARELGRELDDVLIQPLRAHFATRPRLLFIVPDGALNLIPFAALVDPEDRFLIQSYEIGYLASSRDLVRLGSAAPSVTAPVVVADPAFDGAHVDGNSGAGVPFSPLPGALDEGRAIAALLPGATFLTSDAASETRVKDVRSPVILHLATHGFFTSAALSKVKTEAARGLQLVTAAGEVDRYPLLRSGLALSGANLGGRDGEDGLLTAMEAASLDLQGTQLVVLSACQTGLGEVRVGDGVHGLRRALHLAGARSQVMSLWQVSDTATRDLMVAYYQQLMKGVGRGAALRSVQLAMLAGRNHDPFYWAAFVSAGDWRPMPPRGEGSRHD